MGAYPRSTPNRPLPSRVICILGMHRSGTSCLAGSLQEAGLYLGDCHTWNPHNLKGNRENQVFVDLHDEILKENQGAWDLPPKTSRWDEQHFELAGELLRNNACEPVFGFKDPRVLLALGGWKEVYPGMEFVGIFRHPDSVARSLDKRGRMPREKALDLWYQYNRLLFKEYSRSPFPLLCFDDDEEELQDKISRLAVQLGLSSMVERQGFYSSELRSPMNSNELALPWKIRRLYRKLKKRSL